MSREQRIGRADRGHPGQEFPAQSPGHGGQPAALIVAEPMPLVTKLLAKYPVLITQVLKSSSRFSMR